MMTIYQLIRKNKALGPAVVYFSNKFLAERVKKKKDIIKIVKFLENSPYIFNIEFAYDSRDVSSKNFHNLVNAIDYCDNYKGKHNLHIMKHKVYNSLDEYHNYFLEPLEVDPFLIEESNLAML